MRTSPLLLLVVLASCIPLIPVEESPCPCGEGWVCCPGVNVCAASVDRCPEPPRPQVSPAQVEVTTERSVQLQSTSSDVEWSVEGGEANGTIDSHGRYVAPSTPGTSFILARSGAGVTRVPVTVRAPRLSVLAGDYGGPSSVPQDGVGPTARLSDPGDGQSVDEKFYFLDRPVLFGMNLNLGRLLRRFDPKTGAVDSIFWSDGQMVDGSRDVARFAGLRRLAASTPHRLLVIDRACAREIELPALSVTTAFCLPMENLHAVVGAPDAIYYATDVAVHRFDRTTGTHALVVPLTLVGSKPKLLFNGGRLFFKSVIAVIEIDLVTGALTEQTSLLGPPEPLGDFGTELVDAWFHSDSFGSSPCPVALSNTGTIFTCGGFLLRLVSVPTSIALDPEDSAYYLATSPDGLLRTSPGGAFQLLTGRLSPSRGFQVDGPANSARFVLRQAVAVARGDRLWLFEPWAPSIRTITREGDVTTLFRNRDVPLIRSMAVDDTHLYVVVDELPGYALLRAPRDGGDWERSSLQVGDDAKLIGTLDDGRVIVGHTQGFSAIDPATFGWGQRWSIPGRVDDGKVIALDPDGHVYGLVSGTTTLSYELGSTRVVTEGTIAFDRRIDELAAHHGRLYSTMSRFSESLGASVVLRLDASKVWQPEIGTEYSSMVLPGPLPARVHLPRGLAFFGNGDLVILDEAEGTVLVVE